MKILLILMVLVLIGIIVIQIYTARSQKSIDTYAYVVDKKMDNFEIRTYEPTLFASVKLSTSEYKEASSKGFSILAGYIFGENDRNETISMTSPVSMSIEDSMTMMFMVPKNMTKEKLPKPLQSNITFRNEPAKTVAAIRFGGWASDEKIEEYKKKLMAALDKESIKYTNRFYFLGYNPPYELFNRKNEVIVELDD